MGDQEIAAKQSRSDARSAINTGSRATARREQGRELYALRHAEQNDWSLPGFNFKSETDEEVESGDHPACTGTQSAKKGDLV